MNRRVFLVAPAVAAGWILAPAYAKQKKAPSLTDTAKGIVTAFSKGDYAAITKHFDATMTKALPTAKLKEVWEQIQSQAGKFKGQGSVRSAKIEGFDVVYVITKFEKADLECKVVFNDKKQVSGLFFVPVGNQ